MVPKRDTGGQLFSERGQWPRETGTERGGALDSGVIETYDTGKYCEFVAVCIVTTLASAQNK